MSATVRGSFACSAFLSIVAGGTAKPGSNAACQTGEREGGHAQQETPAAAIQIAQASAGDQEHGVGGCITGDDELQFGRVSADRGMDRRQADIDDEEVDRGQQATDDQDDERQPAPRGR